MDDVVRRQRIKLCLSRTYSCTYSLPGTFKEDDERFSDLAVILYELQRLFQDRSLQNAYSSG